MRLDQGGRPVAFDIRVLNGDKSTLLHETAHFLSWSLHDIAHSDLATPEIRADYEGLLKWAGYASGDERQALTRERADLASKADRTPAEESRLKALSAKEERISHGWEQFLLEGKAPSKGLARVFSRFKGWLLNVYKGVAGLQEQYRTQYGEEIGLSDDVRGIFGRLLAEDEAIHQARADSGIPEEPPAEVLAGMSAEEREQHRKLLLGSRAAADQELSARMSELGADQVAGARERISAEVAADLDKQPVYRAMRYLQRGEAVGADGKPLEAVPDSLLAPDGKPYKLNRRSFVEKYGADIAREMPPGVFDRTKKGGVEAEQLGPLLGFESGDDLVDTFRKTEPRDRVLAREAQDRVDSEFGPALKQVAEAAMSAVHNDDAARAALLELRALAKQVDPAAARRVQTMSLEALRASAERLVGESSVSDLDPAKFARIERQSALKAAELWGRGDKEKSFEQREARLFNQLLYRAATDAQEGLEKARTKLENTSDDVRARLGKAGAAYRDVHDQLLSAVGLRERGPAGESLDKLLQLAEAADQVVAFDVDSIRELISNPKDWESLSVEEARIVSRAVTNIRHLAKLALGLDLAGQQETKDAWFGDFQKHLEGRKPLPPEPFDRAAKGAGSKVKSLGRGADAMLTDVPETYSHMLDVGDREGPVHRLLVDGRLEAREKAGELSKVVLEKILEKWENVPKEIRKLQGKKVDLAELLPVPPGSEGLVAPIYTRDTLWSLFLNWGNEGNRQRIRDGNGWTDANIQKALEQLTHPELKFLQGVLDTIQSLYPDIAAVHEKRTGLPLEKVDAIPIIINGESYPGGYFPLKYRPDLSRTGEVQAGETVKALFAPNYVKPATATSHTKSRASKVTAPVDLSWGVVPAHLSQVIHDIAYGDWVRQAGSIALDPRFKKLTEQYLGPERAQEFVPWLRDVANAKADSGSGAQSDFSQKLSSFARNRAAIAVMGMNLPAILPQVLDGWNARSEDVPAHHIAQAYVKVNASLAGAISLPEFALSKELAYRDSALKTNLRAQLAELGPTGHGVGKAMSETAFALYEISDRYTSRVTFKAAYDAALSDGHTQAEAAKRADDVVRRTYASHDIAEKPPIMRSKRGLAALVMFYSFSNRQYNALRRSVDTVGVALGSERLPAMAKASAVGNLAAQLIFMGLTGAAVAYIGGRGPKKDENRAKWLAWRVGLEPFNTVPFMGAALQSMVAGQKVSMRTSPELALVQDSLNRLGDAAHKIQKGEGGDEKVWLAAEALIGAGAFAAGGPVGQLQRTGGYLRKVKTRDVHPRDAADVLSGLVYGERDDQPANPITDIGDALRR